MIKVTVGMRRSGKTYFLFQTIRDFHSQGISIDRIMYINFEDDRLHPINYKEMGQLIDAWYALYPENYDPCCYLFLDKVQNVPDWALVLGRILDQKK